jgi:tRNA-dihydrouridine synthase C
LAWPALLPLMAEFWQLIKAHIEPRARAGRLKQWLNYLRRRYPEAESAYGEVRTINDPMLLGERLFGGRDRRPGAPHGAKAEGATTP